EARVEGGDVAAGLEQRLAARRRSPLVDPLGGVAVATAGARQRPEADGRADEDPAVGRDGRRRLARVAAARRRAADARAAVAGVARRAGVAIGAAEAVVRVEAALHAVAEVVGAGVVVVAVERLTRGADVALTGLVAVAEIAVGTG